MNEGNLKLLDDLNDNKKDKTFIDKSGEKNVSQIKEKSSLPIKKINKLPSWSIEPPLEIKRGSK